VCQEACRRPQLAPRHREHPISENFAKRHNDVISTATAIGTIVSTTDAAVTAITIVAAVACITTIIAAIAIVTTATAITSIVASSSSSGQFSRKEFD
jgi:hypothetical protein